eukprot:scaffold621_cov157-Amphora_coffeaeformis.AAC.6
MGARVKFISRSKDLSLGACSIERAVLELVSSWLDDVLSAVLELVWQQEEVPRVAVEQHNDQVVTVVVQGLGGGTPPRLMVAGCTSSESIASLTADASPEVRDK